MSAVRSTDESEEPADPPRRPYNGTRRRERAAETRDRIVTAGSELLMLNPVRDWRGLTVRAVAERANVNERTVYRYFGSERGLRDAVMQRQEEEAGIDLAGMALDDISEMAARIFDHVASYPIEPRPPLDPTLAQAQQRQREALLGAIAEQATGWTEDEQRVAAAMFDVLWSVASYERLVVDWQIDGGRAIEGITWVIELLEEAVRAGRRPSA
ncbi:MAG TPA: helix-turn-helix domain-containing protein [Acidimicrobiales bacterium]|nr:helix-turn-helix domain-containing protein [Acidimicrobiales bacterium]